MQSKLGQNRLSQNGDGKWQMASKVGSKLCFARHPMRMDVTRLICSARDYAHLIDIRFKKYRNATSVKARPRSTSAKLRSANHNWMTCAYTAPHNSFSFGIIHRTKSRESVIIDTLLTIAHQPCLAAEKTSACSLVPICFVLVFLHDCQALQQL